MASLVEQIFMQANAGSANGASLIEPFAQGMQFGQRQQQIDMQKQQLAAELAQLPLKQTLLQQDAEMNALKIQSVLEGRQDRLINESELLQLNKNVARAFTDAGGPEDAQQMLFESLTRNPRLISDPRFMELRKMVDTSLAAKLQLAEVRASARGSDYTPGFGVDVNPLTGEPQAYFRTGAGSAQLVTDPTVSKPQSTLGKLLADREIAAKAGDANAVAAFDAELKLRQSKDGFSITTNPDGTVTVTQGNQSSLTPANQTRTQDSLASALKTIDIANRLGPILDTDTVGARSFVESWVKDRVLAQAFPEMASNKRATAEALVAQLRSSAISELKTDTNITQKEQDQILRSIPDINTPIDSPARAKQLTASIQKMSAIRAVVAAAKLGQPMPKPAAQVLSDDELINLVNTGVITQDQALQIFDARQ